MSGSVPELPSECLGAPIRSVLAAPLGHLPLSRTRAIAPASFALVLPSFPLPTHELSVEGSVQYSYQRSCTFGWGEGLAGGRGNSCSYKIKGELTQNPGQVGAAGHSMLHSLFIFSSASVTSFICGYIKSKDARYWERASWIRSALGSFHRQRVWSGGHGCSLEYTLQVHGNKLTLQVLHCECELDGRADLVFLGRTQTGVVPS